MSEVLLDYPSSVFEILDEETKTSPSCFELVDHAIHAFHSSEETEAIAQLQKELSSPSSYTSNDEGSSVVPNYNLHSPESPSRYLDNSEDVQMDNTHESSSEESTPSPSPTIHARANLSQKVQTVQILKDLDIKVREDDLANMKIGELSKIAGVRFTKNEEKEIKRLRRKIKNKLSAAQSRQKMKDYVSGLEERVESVTQLNIQLKQRLLELEEENKILKQKIAIPASKSIENNVENSLLQDALSKTFSGKKKAGIYLLMVFLSFGLFYGLSFKNDSIESPHIKLYSSQENFVSRSILSQDMMSKDIFEQTNDSDDTDLWSTYLSSDLQFSNLDPEHDVIITGNPFCEDSHSSSSALKNCNSEIPSDHSLKIKKALEDIPYVEKAYCGDAICLIRLNSKKTDVI